MNDSSISHLNLIDKYKIYDTAFKWLRLKTWVEVQSKLLGSLELIGGILRLPSSYGSDPRRRKSGALWSYLERRNDPCRPK